MVSEVQTTAILKCLLMIDWRLYPKIQNYRKWRTSLQWLTSSHSKAFIPEIILNSGNAKCHTLLVYPFHVLTHTEFLWQSQKLSPPTTIHPQFPDISYYNHSCEPPTTLYKLMVVEASLILRFSRKDFRSRIHTICSWHSFMKATLFFRTKVIALLNLNIEVKWQWEFGEWVVKWPTQFNGLASGLKQTSQFLKRLNIVHDISSN